jgi:23S rRNA (guanine745-N1)-methyltransferase
MHTEVVRWLRCPICHGTLSMDSGPRSDPGPAVAPLRCPSGHSFDPARRGYVQLTARPVAHDGDTAAMLTARARFLGAGHFDPITSAVRDAAADAWRGGLVVDVGAGTGHHLARVLDARPETWGIGVDASKAAARACAQAHLRADAILADVWQPLPLADDSAGVVLDIFAPRNAPEFARVLRPDGVLIVVTPAADHLATLVAALGLLTVDPAKPTRLTETLGDRFVAAGSRPYRWIMNLNHDDVAAVVAMGPSAWHTDQEALATAIAALPDSVRVEAAVTLGVYRPRR